MTRYWLEDVLKLTKSLSRPASRFLSVKGPGRREPWKVDDLPDRAYWR